MKGLFFLLLIEGVAKLGTIAFWRFHRSSTFNASTLLLGVCEFVSNIKSQQNRLKSNSFRVLQLPLALLSWQGMFSEEMVVQLDTDNALTPIEMTSSVDPTFAFSKKYCQDLQELISFDFNHNGATCICQDRQVYTPWKIEIAFKEQSLFAKVRGFDSKQIGFDGIVLSGEFDKDSRKIHQLSDQILEHLCGIKGIASCRLLYTVRHVKDGKEFSDVWEADYDGKGARRVTNNAGYCVTPQYIPPDFGKMAGSFVFVSYQTGQPKIYAAKLQDGVGQRLLKLSGNQLMPTISKQRNRLAFISDVTGNPDLFLQDFDPKKGGVGKPRHLYTAPNATQGTPAFSPDGGQIAFVSNKSGTPRIYTLIIPPPGKPLKEMKPKLISKFTRGNTAPTWSPDGEKIAYCAIIEGVRQIMICDLSTGEETQLTTGRINKENPTFAPNSLHLVYNTTGTDGGELYLINLKQKEPVKITKGPGEKRFPHFEPRQ